MNLLNLRSIAVRAVSTYRVTGPPGPKDKRTMMNGITRMATTVLVSAGVGLAGIGIASGIAMARPSFAPLTTWCPGQNRPAVAPWPDFDWSVCHHYEGSNQGIIDLDTGIVHPFPGLTPPGPPPPPNPPQCIGLIPLPGVDPSHCVI